MISNPVWALAPPVLCVGTGGSDLRVVGSVFRVRDNGCALRLRGIRCHDCHAPPHPACHKGSKPTASKEGGFYFRTPTL
eukprot:2978041-Rhodomonas_salina.2